jgi:hypothetical protein
MQILIASAGTRWNNWIARVLSRVVAAFDHDMVQLLAPAGTAAFEEEFRKAGAECEAVIALNPADGVASAPDDWPSLALETATASARKAALVRAGSEPLCFPNAPNLLDCDPTGSADCVVAIARLLGSWRPRSKARFLLGPEQLIGRLKREFGERQIVVEYSIDSPLYVRTRWLAAEKTFSPGAFEVRTEPLPPDSRIQIRVSIADEVYESEFSPIDRRVMDLSPSVAIDPREVPRFLTSPTLVST